MRVFVPRGTRLVIDVEIDSEGSLLTGEFHAVDGFKGMADEPWLPSTTVDIITEEGAVVEVGPHVDSVRTIVHGAGQLITHVGTHSVYNTARVHATGGMVRAYDSTNVYASQQATVEAFHDSVVRAAGQGKVTAHHRSTIYSTDMASVTVPSGEINAVTINASGSSTVESNSYSTVGVFLGRAVGTGYFGAVTFYERSVAKNVYYNVGGAFGVYDHASLHGPVTGFTRTIGADPQPVGEQSYTTTQDAVDATAPQHELADVYGALDALPGMLGGDHQVATLDPRPLKEDHDMGRHSLNDNADAIPVSSLGITPETTSPVVDDTPEAVPVTLPDESQSTPESVTESAATDSAATPAPTTDWLSQMTSITGAQQKVPRAVDNVPATPEPAPAQQAEPGQKEPESKPTMPTFNLPSMDQPTDGLGF